MATLNTPLIRASALAAKIEPTSGVDAAPTLFSGSTLTNAVTLVGTPPSLTITALETNDREVTAGGLGNFAQPASAGWYGSFDITLEPKGTGAAPTSSASPRPEIDVFERMSGHAAAYNAAAPFGSTTGGAWVYSDIDSGFETGTVYFWSAGLLYKLVGCVATKKISMTANKVVNFSYTVTGRLLGGKPTEAVIPGAPIVATTIAPIFSGGEVKLGSLSSLASGETLLVQKVEIDEGITTAPLPSAGAVLDGAGTPNTTGVVGFRITDRKPSETITVIQPSYASLDPYAAAIDPNSAPSLRGVFPAGAAVGNRVVVLTGQMIPGVPKRGDSNGIATVDLTGKILYASETLVSNRSLATLVG